MGRWGVFFQNRRLQRGAPTVLTLPVETKSGVLQTDLCVMIARQPTVIFKGMSSDNRRRIGVRQLPRPVPILRACALALALGGYGPACADPRVLEGGGQAFGDNDAAEAQTPPAEALAEAPARLGLSLRAIVKQGGRGKAFISRGAADVGLWVGEGAAVDGLTVLSIDHQSVVLQGEGSSYRLTLNYNARGGAGTPAAPVTAQVNAPSQPPPPPLRLPRSFKAGED